jgi:hypothetical protein
MQTQTPKEEAAERAAEAIPTYLFPRMVEALHHNRQRKNHRRQLEHDRAVQSAILRGDKPPEWSKHERDEDEDMGDSFSIVGDTTHHYHYDTPPPPSASSQPQEGNAAQPKSTASTLAKAALVAAGLVAGGGLGAGIPWLAGAFDKPAAVNTTIQQPAQNLGVGVDVVPGGATEALQ